MQSDDMQMYQAAAEYALVGVYVFQDGKFRFVNPAMAEAFGYRPDELMGEFDSYSLIHPDDRSIVKRDTQRRLKGELQGTRYQARGVRKDGSTMHFEAFDRRVELDGRPAIVGTLLDVSQRLRAEHQLTTLSRAVEHSASVVVITDAQGVIEYVNPKFSEVTGHSADQAIGQHVRILRSEHTPAGTYPRLWETILAGNEWKGLFRNKKRNGELYWASSTISPIHNDQGQIQQFIAVQEDVTEQVLAETTLRKQATDLALLNSLNNLINAGEDFESITDHLADQIKLIFGCESVTLYLLNPEGDRLDMVRLGMDPEMMRRIEKILQRKIPTVSMPLREVDVYREALNLRLPEVIRDPAEIMRLMALHTDSPVLKKAVPAVARMIDFQALVNVPLRLDSEPVGLLTIWSTADFNQGEVERLAALAGPITVAIMRKRTEDRLRQFTEELEQRVEARTAELEIANRELESFTYSVSHDLRAPLRSIDGFTRALQEEYGDRFDQIGEDYMERVINATHRMSQLIEDLLNLSRVTRAEIHREQVDVGELAAAIAIELQHAEPERSVEFRLEPPIPAYGDPGLLRVVVQNLLDNAWKFTAERSDPKVEIGPHRVNGQKGFYVRDNGAGFDMQYADKVFAAFQRLHSTREFPGTGIGLASVQRVVLRHGGTVWAEGQVDKGATFYVTLPTE